MRFVMRQHLLSFGDDFSIRDADERDVCFVDGRAFSLGEQRSFQDMEKSELAAVVKKEQHRGDRCGVPRRPQAEVVA